MPGRTHRDFRKGNLAEELGLLLLKGIAAVAEVPRPEDVGLDAVATLLRRADDDNLYAEDSFVVQLKSSRTKAIVYRDHELQWLVGQTQPMFVGLVSLSESSIELYPTVYVNHAVWSLPATWAKVQFGPSGLPPAMRGQQWLPWSATDHGGVTVWLGEPLLRWTLADISGDVPMLTAYRSLKRFLPLARHELALRAIDQMSVLNWSTNEPDSVRSVLGPSRGSGAELERIVGEAVPYLDALLLHASCYEHLASRDLMQSLHGVADALARMGIEPDEKGRLESFLNWSRWFANGRKA